MRFDSASAHQTGSRKSLTHRQPCQTLTFAVILISILIVRNVSRIIREMISRFKPDAQMKNLFGKNERKIISRFQYKFP